MNSARLPARPLALLKGVQIHVDLACLEHGVARVVPEPLRNGVGHDAEALPELVHEAERELAMPHRRAGEEESWRFGALVMLRE